MHSTYYQYITAQILNISPSPRFPWNSQGSHFPVSQKSIPENGGPYGTFLPGRFLRLQQKLVVEIPERQKKNGQNAGPHQNTHFCGAFLGPVSWVTGHPQLLSAMKIFGHEFFGVRKSPFIRNSYGAPLVGGWHSKCLTLHENSVRTCQEATPIENYLSNNHPFSGAMLVSQTVTPLQVEIVSRGCLQNVFWRSLQFLPDAWSN